VEGYLGWLEVLLFHGTNATMSGALVSRKVDHDFIEQRVLQVLNPWIPPFLKHVTRAGFSSRNKLRVAVIYLGTRGR
jgi:hypothetical protein